MRRWRPGSRFRHRRHLRRDKSEEFLGKALGKRRQDITLATKFRHADRRRPRRMGGSRRWIMRAWRTA